MTTDARTHVTTVDERDSGHRDERGNWIPAKPHEYAPIFEWPPRPLGFGRWLLRSYLFSWNLVYAGGAVGAWLWLTPSAATARSIHVAWIIWLLARNLAIVSLFYGGWHVRLYRRRSQGTLFKFNPRWPRTDSSVFLFGSQTRDNVFWTLVSGVPIWTAFEVVMLWAHANGHVTALTWADDGMLIVLLMLAVPAFRDVHFYLTHRLLHVRILYQRFHRLHHNNTNPGPWSGLAMHPVEHLLYFTGVLVHFVVAAHPVVIIYQLMHAGLAPAAGHSGFEKVVVERAGKIVRVDTGSFNHYLHHNYFECNYADGPFPLDRWFGTFNDGSPAAQAAMKMRLRQRRAVVRSMPTSP